MNTLVGLVSGPLNCDVILQQLWALPRPRRVASSWRGKLSSLVAYLSLSFFGVLSIGLIWKGFSGGQIGWTIVALVLLVLALLALLNWNSKLTRPNQRSLLATGEVTVGRIVTQRVQGGSKGVWSEITYEFTGTLGCMGDGIASDLTWQYSENMPVIIFYNPHALAENLPICSTYLRVRMQDGTLLSPS